MMIESAKPLTAASHAENETQLNTTAPGTTTSTNTANAAPNLTPNATSEPKHRHRKMEDLLYPPPTSENSLPHVTLGMLIDSLAGLEVLMASDAVRRTFRWYVVVNDDGTCALPTHISASQLLFVCDSSNAIPFLTEHPTAFALVRTEGEKLAEYEPWRERIVAISKREHRSYVAFFLQVYFTRVLLWENDLERIALRQGGLTDMLDASAAMLGNFIFVSDNNFNVIARTTCIDPPDDLHRTIISKGHLTPSTIAEKRFRLPERTFYTREASEITPFDRVSCPVHVNHSYFGSISMSCNATPDTLGLRDMFLMLVRYMTPLCEKIWNQQTNMGTPSYFFFAKLIEHEPMSEEYLKAQMEMAGLSEMTHFKLVMLNVDESVEPERARLALKAAATLNDANVICFPYQHSVLALLYARDIDGKLAHPRTAAELEQRVFMPYDIISGVSSVFNTSITDLDLAFRQAKIALGFRGSIQQEQFTEEGGARAHGVYLFEDALLYYLIDASEKDRRFMQFSFSCSLTNVLYQEDQANGTNYLALMWFYLQSERNATAVAKRMHMHRNTVLYHVDKIQKRFCFDLSSKTARDWMLLSYKFLFLMLSRESLDQIFSEAANETPPPRRKAKPTTNPLRPFKLLLPLCTISLLWAAQPRAPQWKNHQTTVVIF